MSVDLGDGVRFALNRQADRIAQLEAQLRELQASMECGHPKASLVEADGCEHPAHCSDCERERAIERAVIEGSLNWFPAERYGELREAASALLQSRLVRDTQRSDEIRGWILQQSPTLRVSIEPGLVKIYERATPPAEALQAPQGHAQFLNTPWFVAGARLEGDRIVVW